jgi:hypothetical protein
MRVDPKNLKRLFIAEAKSVDDAVQKAARHALLVHKRAGCTVSSWENGRLVITPPEEIRIDDQPGEERA